MSAESLAEQIRGWFQEIQNSKEGEDRLTLQPIWNLVNAVPEIVVLLERHDEFVKDSQLEAAEGGQEELLSALIHARTHYCGGTEGERRIDAAIANARRRAGMGEAA